MKYTLVKKDSFYYKYRNGDILYNEELDKILSKIPYDKIWLTSDLHFFKVVDNKKNIMYYNILMKDILHKQQSKVAKDDVYIILGDLSYKKTFDPEYLDMISNLIKQMNGKLKILVRGNHDMLDKNYYTEKMGFDYVVDFLNINDNLFLTHVPQLLEDDDEETINIHGHIHGDKTYKNMEPKNHYDVYIGGHEYYPITISKVLKKVNDKDYCAGFIQYDKKWDNYDKIKEKYKSLKESCKFNKLQFIEDIKNIKGSSMVEDTLINILIDNIIHDTDIDVLGGKVIIDDYPYFIPDEMDNLGVFSDNPNDNCYNVPYSPTFIDDDKTISSKDWYNEYKLFCKGIYTEKFEIMIPKWRDKVRELSGSLENNNSNYIKQSLLELGWHPELNYNNKIRNRVNDRIKPLIEYYYNDSNILDVSYINKLDDNEIIEENSKDKLYPVYIVLSYTNTKFGKLCVGFTKGKYSHSGLSLDADLKRIYTFTGDSKYGFAVENLDIYSQNCDDELSKLGVYCVFVTKEDLRKIKLKLDYFLLNRYDFKYSYLGIITLLMNKDVHFNNAMICSQFVSFILQAAGINLLGKASTLTQPDDYYRANNDKIYLLYDGHIKEYNYKKVQNIVNKLSKSARYIKESTDMICESYINSTLSVQAITEYKELPVEFNDEGDLLIKRRKTISFRKEYFKSHEILLEYNKSNNIEGIKYELSKLWFLNLLIEEKLYGGKLKDEGKKEYTDVRAKILNDFKKYMRVVLKHEKFNFQEYYNNTPFNDDKLKIKNNTIKYSIENIKNILKLL